MVSSRAVCGSVWRCWLWVSIAALLGTGTGHVDAVVAKQVFDDGSTPETAQLPLWAYDNPIDGLTRCVSDPDTPFCGSTNIRSPADGGFFLLPTTRNEATGKDMMGFTITFSVRVVKDLLDFVNSGATVHLGLAVDNTTHATDRHALTLHPNITSEVPFNIPYRLGFKPEDAGAGMLGTTILIWLIYDDQPLPGSFSWTSFDFRSDVWQSLAEQTPGMVQDDPSLLDDPVLSPCAPRQEAFVQVYGAALWTTAGGGSGVGSTVDITRFTQRALTSVILRYGVHSVVDASCGRFTWQPRVFLPLRPVLDYVVGLDVVPDVIQHVAGQFQDQPTWFFLHADIVEDQLADLPLPPAVKSRLPPDLILLRDTVAHMCDRDALKVLRRMVDSGARYLLVTHQPSRAFNYHRPEEWKTLDLAAPPQFKGGGYRCLNLQLPPFVDLLGHPVELLPEGADGKFLALYKLR